MSDLKASGGAKEHRLRAVVTRADGSVEDYGEISYWHKNPLRRLWWWLRNAPRLRRVRRRFGQPT